MLDASTMECDRVNLCGSTAVKKSQQIFETIPVRHGAPLSDWRRSSTTRTSCTSAITMRTRVSRRAADLLWSLEEVALLVLCFVCQELPRQIYDCPTIE